MFLTEVIILISLEEFHQDFLQSILSDAECRGLMKSQAFFENVCEELITTGDLTNNYTYADYIKFGMEAYGYDYDEERKILSILVYQFFQEEEIETLTKNTIDIKFKRLKKFFEKCIQGNYTDIEPTSGAYSMAYNIYKYKNEGKINKVRLIILTDGKVTRNLNKIPYEIIDGINVEFRIFDIEYIYKIYLSHCNSSSSNIDITIPCLKIETASNEYESYLAVIKGEQLADIYEEFGQKLFEQNVRTFLQFRGKVNKGIRNTIEYGPDKFFAYNNGITATASDVKIDAQGNIIQIADFQIVNGGQTTSAIYAARKNSKLDISDVSVQMKLSIVRDKENQNDFVSKVSEYANTQNKVNKSDFFSNSPFHKEMKRYSKKIWVPAVDGSQRLTHWFYERVRGEYLNEQAYLTNAEKKRFKLENPKKQLVDKTFLSKSENVWFQRPDIVSKGAQYSFALFAQNITDKLEEDNLAITESYFKDAVSRVILFRTVEKIVSNAEWYDGGFRAQTVAYTISYLSYLVHKTGKFFDFNLIWQEQKLPDSLIRVLDTISECVYDKITNPPQGFANVAQWCKKQICWESVRSINLNIEINEELLINKEKQKYNKREDRKEKKLESGIEIQMFVVKTKKEIWGELYKYYEKYKSTAKISNMQLDILKKMVYNYLNPPSEKQSKILYELYKKADSEGVKLPDIG